MQGVKVVLRDEYNEDGQLLCEVPFPALQATLHTVKSWGVSTDDDVSNDAVGQFVLTESEAYFEIIVTHD